MSIITLRKEVNLMIKKYEYDMGCLIEKFIPVPMEYKILEFIFKQKEIDFTKLKYGEENPKDQTDKFEFNALIDLISFQFVEEDKQKHYSFILTEKGNFMVRNMIKHTIEIEELLLEVMKKIEVQPELESVMVNHFETERTKKKEYWNKLEDPEMVLFQEIEYQSYIRFILKLCGLKQENIQSLISEFEDLDTSCREILFQYLLQIYLD